MGGFHAPTHRLSLGGRSQQVLIVECVPLCCMPAAVGSLQSMELISHLISPTHVFPPLLRDTDASSERLARRGCRRLCLAA